MRQLCLALRLFKTKGYRQLWLVLALLVQEKAMPETHLQKTDTQTVDVMLHDVALLSPNPLPLRMLVEISLKRAIAMYFCLEIGVSKLLVPDEKGKSIWTFAVLRYREAAISTEASLGNRYGLSNSGRIPNDAFHITADGQMMMERPAPSITQIVAIAKQMARAFSFFHACDFVHKSIRPENVLIFPPDPNSEPTSDLVPGSNCLSFRARFSTFKLNVGLVLTSPTITGEETVSTTKSLVDRGLWMTRDVV